MASWPAESESGRCNLHSASVFGCVRAAAIPGHLPDVTIRADSRHVRRRSVVSANWRLHRGNTVQNSRNPHHSYHFIERAMRCRAEFANKPQAPHPNEPVAGTELPCIVRHFRVRVHPRSRGGRCARRDACSTASVRQVVFCRSCDRGQVYCSKACSARSRTDRPPGRPSGCVRGDCPGRRARAARERPLRARYFPDWAGIGCSRPEIQTAARSIPAPHFTPLTVLRRSSPGY